MAKVNGEKIWGGLENLLIQQIFIEQLLGTRTVIEKVANKITNALTLMMLTL